MPPEGTSDGILKSYRPSAHLSARQSVRYKSCLSHNSETTEANSMKLYRKMKQNEKVWHTQDLGSYAQGQRHNWVRDQIRVSGITQKLLKPI